MVFPGLGLSRHPPLLQAVLCYFFERAAQSCHLDHHHAASPASRPATSSPAGGRRRFAVFLECNRVLKQEGLLVFTYHHSRDEGWTALAEAVLGAGFIVVNAHPLKSEMSVATPKAQTQEPIQLDIAIVCRKATHTLRDKPERVQALSAAQEKLSRLESVGFKLSRNDERVMLFGQLLTTIRSITEVGDISKAFENELAMES